MQGKLEERFDEKQGKIKNFVVFLPRLNTDVYGYYKILKEHRIGRTWASSEKDAVGHYLFRFTQKSSPIQPLPISESDAKIIASKLKRAYQGVGKFAFEVNFHQTVGDLEKGGKMSKGTLKAHAKLRTADYFENLFGRRITDEEYEMIGKVID